MNTLGNIVKALVSEGYTKEALQILEYKKKESLDKTESKTAISSRLETFLDLFRRRHPKIYALIRRYKLKIIDKEGSVNRGEARQEGLNNIMLFEKFWTHDVDIQDAILTHEIGHAVLTQYGPYSLHEAGLIEIAKNLGIDMWDTPSLPYGQYNMHEAFADVFAEYFLHRNDLKRRYPKWLALVEIVLNK